MKSFLLLVVLICSNFSWGNDIDLRFLFPPIRNQGEVGNCFAQVGADLLTAYLNSSNPKLISTKNGGFVSPTALSFCSKYSELDKEFADARKKRAVADDPDNLKKVEKIKILSIQLRDEISKMSNPDFDRTKYTELNSGFKSLCEQLNLNRAKCESKFLWPRPEIDPYNGKGTILIEYRAKSLDAGYIQESITNSIAQCGICFQNSYGKMDQQVVQSFDKLLDTYVNQSIDIEAEQCNFESLSSFNSQSTENFREILIALQKNELKEHPAISFFKQSCLSNLAEINNLEAKLKNVWIEEKNVKENSETISKLIEKGIPVGISYYAAILKADGNAKEHAAHASTIVGQKLIAGKLHFILRNSWGPESCLNELQKAKKLSAKMKFKCEAGDYVLEAKNLTKVIFGLTYIEK